MKRQSLLASACPTVITAALLLPSAALAQTPSAQDSWVGEVVVTADRGSFTAPTVGTATKTPTPIEEVPQSIQALTRTFIEEQDLQSVSEALVNVSGMAPSKTREIVLQSPKIRGFDASYYIDGLAAYGLPSGVADPGTLINVERVEVAKGPTSTLYGGGTGAPLSGLINLVSRDPGQQPGLEVGVRFGSDATYGADINASLPVQDGAVRLGLAGSYETADSFLHSIDSKRYAVYPTLIAQLGPDTGLTLRGQLTRIEQQEYAGLPYALINSATVDRFAFAGSEDAPPTVINNRLFTASLNHSFGTQWEGTLTARRYDSDFSELSTFPFTGLPVAGTTYAFATAALPTEVEQTLLSASLLKRAGSGPITHQILMGVDYDEADYTAGLGFGFLGFIDYALPASNLAWPGPPALSDRQTDSMKTVAAYVQDQIGLGDRLDVTLGLRWSKVAITSHYESGGFAFVDTDKTYNRLTPRIGATYRLTDGVSAFAGYSEGFKGLVAAFGLTDPKPETSQSYEAGLKLVSPIKGLTGTVAAYQVTRQNVSTASPTNPFASIQAGEQRAKGVEADLVFEPGPAVSVLGSYAYTQAEVTKDNTLPIGDRLTRVPEHSGRVAVRYRFQSEALKGLEIGGGATAVSSRELTLPNSQSVGGSVLFDAQASYDLGRATIAVSIVNLTDEDSFEPYQYLARAVVTPAQPRSGFVTLRAKF